MKKGLAAIMLLILAVAIVVGGCSQYGKQTQTTSTQPTSPAAQPASPPASPPIAPPGQPAPQASGGKIYTIVMTNGLFTPEILEIKAGDTVSFFNNDSLHPHWPASGPHPTHTLYPETGGCIGSKFDACKELAFGESFNFTFNIKGTWPFHDHLNPIVRGKIVVD